MLERLPSSGPDPSLACQHAEADVRGELREQAQSCRRSHILHSPRKLYALVIIHPSALLRIRELDVKKRSRLTFIKDLKNVRSSLRH